MEIFPDALGGKFEVDLERVHSWYHEPLVWDQWMEMMRLMAKQRVQMIVAGDEQRLRVMVTMRLMAKQVA